MMVTLVVYHRCAVAALVFSVFASPELFFFFFFNIRPPPEFSPLPLPAPLPTPPTISAGKFPPRLGPPQFAAWASSCFYVRGQNYASSDIFLRGRSLHGGADHLCRLSPLRSEEHTSELQSQSNLVCRLLLEKKNK